jgi:hypothetical protein
MNELDGMDPIVEALIERLQLKPHPEGGYYRELHRSAQYVKPTDGRPVRSALTTIYFLLPAGVVSRWHRVSSDEVWHHMDGAPLELLVIDPGFKQVERTTIGPLRDGSSPEAVVPPHYWQAARSTGAYSVACCVVGPGFDFADFDLLRDRPEDEQQLRAKQPELAAYI